jgi:predicted lipoprotein with Yx(FWY)xxD motif
MEQTRGRLTEWQPLGLRLAGAGLLLATGAIHLDLYLTGYRSLPTIGWLFLLQVIAAFVLGLVVAVTGSRVAALAGAGFAVATLGGYLLSVWVGLFGFKEIRTTAGLAAGVIEAVAFAVLTALALRPASRPRQAGAAAAGRSWPDRLQAGLPGAGLAAAGLGVVALAVLIATVATASGQQASAGGRLQARDIHGVSVLTNAKGFTLYWFVPDSSTRSVCNGTCAAYWPPVLGTPTAGPGVTGHIGTIKRSDGATQATYDGHPLYTYQADSGPGQAAGNNINLNGGLWHEVVASS